MDIVFNINPLALEGFGATLSSLIRHCSDHADLKLWVLCSDVNAEDKEKITRLLQTEQFAGRIEFVDFDAKKTFGHLRSLHGDWTAYGRLLVADFVQAEQVLYLDSDIVVLLDVLQLKAFDFRDKLLAAVVFDKHVKTTLDHRFFLEKLNWHPETPYFNSGVVLLNLRKWRQEETSSKIRQIAEKYPNDLVSHDQTLLNAVCEEHFVQLPDRFNSPWYSGETLKAREQDAIIHFVGSPKPWDVLGSFVHKGFGLWNRYNNPFWKKAYGRVDTKKIRRAWRLKKSYLKGIRSLLKRT